jgi:hypothetical protein
MKIGRSLNNMSNYNDENLVYEITKAKNRNDLERWQATCYSNIIGILEVLQEKMNSFKTLDKIRGVLFGYSVKNDEYDLKIKLSELMNNLNIEIENYAIDHMKNWHMRERTKQRQNFAEDNKRTWGKLNNLLE